MVIMGRAKDEREKPEGQMVNGVKWESRIWQKKKFPLGLAMEVFCNFGESYFREVVGCLLLFMSLIVGFVPRKTN